MGVRKKSALEKVVDKVVEEVDHIIHPDHSKSGLEQESESVGVVTKLGRIDERKVESSSQESDLAKHPKFAKFKSPGGNS